MDKPYDYLEAVKSDAEYFIKENCMDSLLSCLKGECSRNSLEEELYEAMYDEDSVTGNGSGSYWFSRANANDALCGNLELLGEAVEEYDGDFISQLLKEGPEACDVHIRIYLLHRAIELALEDVMTDELLDNDGEEDK